MPFQTDLSADPIHRGTTPKLTYKVEDEDGVFIPGTSLTTITATIKREDTGVAIAGFGTDTDIKNLQGNSVDGSGVGTWVLPTTATTCLLSDVGEFFLIEIKWTYNAGAQAGEHEIRVRIV